MLEIKNISKYYGYKKVFEDYSLSLPDYGVFAISAPSGSGKTTLLRMIAGLEKPDRGKIILPESPKISMVFQEDRLLYSLSVRDNITVVLSGSDKTPVNEYLESCGLRECAGNNIVSLSGGMKRRVAIARAIAFGGNILLLDEPFKGLDSGTKSMTANFVFKNKRNRLTIMITHDSSEAEAYADEIIKWQ